MKIAACLMLCVVSIVHLGCQEAQEFLGFVGTPDGDDGWRHDYNDSPSDVWDVLRTIVRDNGKITDEDPEKMRISGLNIPNPDNEDDSYMVEARVLDLSDDAEVRTRVHLRVWYDDANEDNGYPDIAREYCYTVRRVLRERNGTETKPDLGVQTGSEDPIKNDEAVGFYRVTVDQAFSVATDVVKEFGEVDQQSKDKGFIRGHRIIPLEDKKDDVRVQVYDRSEGEGKRVKISVRVTDKDNKAQQDIAKKYLEEIRKELESRFGKKDQE